MSLACAQCPVRDSAACAVLEPAEREALARAGRTVDLNAGEMLFAAGDENAACATLVCGALKVSNCDADGTEHILALVHPAGFVGEMFAPFARHDVIALAPSRLCVFARGDLEAALADYPRLSGALLRRAQEDLHSARTLLALGTRTSAAARVAGLIAGFAQGASTSPCHPAARFDLPLSRGEMAAMLGLTIETVSRQFGKLESRGAIRRHGKRGIELVDPALLHQLAD